MNDTNNEQKNVINNEFDYSNAIPTIECVTYLVEYCYNLYNQLSMLIAEDEKRNEPLKYEYKNYNYKHHYMMEFEVYIREKSYNNIKCDDLETFKSAVEDGNLKNIDSMDIKLDLSYKRGRENELETYENSYTILIKPFDMLFARKSNHSEENMNLIESNINEILKKFPTVNSIFCTK